MLSCINLMQPWADAIVAGLLPILARRFPIKKRGTIGICVTNGMDGIFLETLSDRDLLLAERYLIFDHAIGSVNLERCEAISRSKVWDELERIGGKELRAFYPTHFMPNTDPVYFWHLSSQIRFRRPLPIHSKGITWSTIEEDSDSQKSSKRKNFWREANYKSFIEMNKSLREYDLSIC